MSDDATAVTMKMDKERYETEEKNILTALEQHPEVAIAFIFGSIANRSATWESDLDIAVQGNKPLTTEQHIELVEDLALATGRPIDLIDLKTAGVPLLGEILKGKRILGSDTDHAEILKRHLFDTADFLSYGERILKERREQWIK